jgi:hypothetical protein
VQFSPSNRDVGQDLQLAHQFSVPLCLERRRRIEVPPIDRIVTFLAQWVGVVPVDPKESRAIEIGMDDELGEPRSDVGGLREAVKPLCRPLLDEAPIEQQRESIAMGGHPSLMKQSGPSSA